MPSTRLRNNHGFTLIEVLVIAPIVILAVGAFVAVMVNMTAEVLKTQSENSMVQSTQDTLAAIERDTKLSGAFLAGNELVANAPQGYNDGTGPINDNSNADSFANVYPTGNAKAKMLILRSFTTDKNPLDGTRQPIYTNQPTFSCTPKTINKLFAANTVYFIKNGTLWKRTITQQGSGRPDLCLDPGQTVWQQPSCSAAVTKGTYCAVNDTRLVDNVSDFTIDYFVNPSDTTPIADATDSTKTITQRNAALANATTIRASITTTSSIAGRSVTNTAAIRATKLNVTSDAPVFVTLGFSQQPSDATVIPADGSTTFSATANISTATYQWQVSTDGGTTWANTTDGANYSGSTTNTLTVSGFTTSWNGSAYVGWNGYKYRAVATNYGNTATTNAATLNVSNWGSIGYVNNYSDYGSPYTLIGYTKTSSGFVMLKGNVKRSGTPVQNEIIGQLPLNYRPCNRLMFETSSSADTSSGMNSSRIDIDTNGNILFEYGDAGYLALDGINFMPSNSPSCSSGFTSLTLANGWVNYGASSFGGNFANAQYSLDSLNRVHVQGVVKGGTVSDGTQIVTNIPAASLSSEYLHVPARSSGFGYIGIDPVNGIVAKGGPNTNTYLSLNSMYIPNTTSGWNSFTLGNGWVPFGGFSTPSYIKTSDNVVSLKGLIKSGAVANGTLINPTAPLPVGYRPKDRTLIAGGVTNGKSVRYDVRPDGYIEIYYGDANWASLDAINFLAEQ